MKSDINALDVIAAIAGLLLFILVVIGIFIDGPQISDIALMGFTLPSVYLSIRALRRGLIRD